MTRLPSAWAIVGLIGCGNDPQTQVVPQPVTSEVGPTPSQTLTNDPQVTAGPEWVLPTGALAHGALELHVTTDVPTTLTLHITDVCGSRTLSFEGAATEHRAPVVGLHIGGIHRVEMELTTASGSHVQPIDDAVVPTPTGLPGLDVLSLDATRVEPGLLVVAPISPLRGSWVLAYDEQMHLVYALERQVEDLRIVDGSLLALHEGRGVRWDLFGREEEAWEGRFLNHELFPLADGGVLALDHEVVEESDYPVDLKSPKTAPAQLRSQAVVRFGADHAEVERLSLADVLDTTHVGYFSLGGGQPVDWSHANAVVPWGDDAYVVSVRHLDVVVCMGRDGTLRWLLGDPTGWEEPWASAFLDPVGPLTWPRHQHALDVTEEGLLLMFDNGNHGGSPSAPPAADYVEVSRGVAWRIDETARTVSEAWSVSHEGLFSVAMGDVDLLPSGLVLLTYSNTGSLPLQSRMVQLDPAAPDTPALDVVFTGGNRYTYRAEVVSGFAIPGVQDSRW